MRQTLFYIPHWIFEGPLLIAWLVIGLAVIAYLFAKHGNVNETWSFLPVFGIVTLAIYLLPPHLEVTGINPADPAGPEIVRGVTADDIIGLGFWMMICGIAGARLFYVIQKRDEFFTGAPLQETILNMVNMTKGGLVVYGSLIGGTLAALIYLKIHKLPVLKIADLRFDGAGNGVGFDDRPTGLLDERVLFRWRLRCSASQRCLSTGFGCVHAAVEPGRFDWNQSYA